jgi:tRNA G37 N-methylase TrmD
MCRNENSYCRLFPRSLSPLNEHDETASRQGIAQIYVHDLRDHTTDKHRSVMIILMAVARA